VLILTCAQQRPKGGCDAPHPEARIPSARLARRIACGAWARARSSRRHDRPRERPVRVRAGRRPRTGAGLLGERLHERQHRLALRLRRERQSTDGGQSRSEDTSDIGERLRRQQRGFLSADRRGGATRATLYVHAAAECGLPHVCGSLAGDCHLSAGQRSVQHRWKPGSDSRRDHLGGLYRLDARGRGGERHSRVQVRRPRDAERHADRSDRILAPD
jgi:hypothetical protein